MSNETKKKLLCALLAACACAPCPLDAHATRTKRLPQNSNRAAVAANTRGQDGEPVVNEEEQRDLRRTYRKRLPPKRPIGAGTQPEPRRRRSASRARQGPSKNIGEVAVTPPGRELKPDAAEFDFIGFTMWKMQPDADAPEEVEKKRKESRKIFYGKKHGKGLAYIPVRMGIEGALVEGQFYRFSVTATRAGFLYLISREEYADGETGDPELLFPIKREGAEDNFVQPGRVIEIPNLKDDPGYFEVRRTGEDHIGEILLIIVSETPLKLPSSLGAEPLKLSAGQVAEWETQWRTKWRWVDEPEAARSSYTAAEEMAGTDAKQLLTEFDPLPQRLYRIPSRQGIPLLVKLRLRYASL